MEEQLLIALGGPGSSRSARPPMDLASLDVRTRLLQVNAIERSTAKAYSTGARDYIRF
jgi:hypothetical protein